jgi:hypothetical protein
MSMSELSTTTEALSAVRDAIANDLASVGAAITNALADVDTQLEVLHGRRDELETALGAVREQISATDVQRAGLVAALEQVGAEESASGGPAAPPASVQGTRSPDAVESEGDEEWVDFDEASLSPDLPRTERIVAVLVQAQQPLPSADIAGVLNAYGDSTTTKVVSGTLANLVKRGLVVKVKHGMYAAT